MPREGLFPYTRRYAIVQIGMLRIRRSSTRDQFPRWILPMNLDRGYIIELRKSGRDNPDTPLGEVIAKKSRQRAIMGRRGGCKALITRTPVKPGD
jgi:hypothetical protein